MNPIGKITRAITRPVEAAGSVAGQALEIAAAGARTTARVMDWTATQARGGGHVDHTAEPTPAPTPRTAAPPPVPAVPGAGTSQVPQTSAATPAPAPAKAPARKTPAKKAPARKAPAKKAPSAKAATAGPALAAAAKEAGEDPSLATPVDDTWAVDADLDSSEPLLDPSVAKAVRSESEVMSRAADPDKG
jgi:hypothetical protein